MQAPRVCANSAWLLPMLAESLDQRREGVQALQTLVKENLQTDKQFVKTLFSFLNDLIAADPPELKEAGLVALVALANCLLYKMNTEIINITDQILNCFSDEDSGVRYVACKSICEIVKLFPVIVLIKFDRIFKLLPALVLDCHKVGTRRQDSTEILVKDGGQYLEGFMKDAALKHFIYLNPSPNFIPTFTIIAKSNLAEIRIFILKWLNNLLNTGWELHLMLNIHLYLQSLFEYLADPLQSIRIKSLFLISDLYNKITSTEVVYKQLDFVKVLKVVDAFLESKQDEVKSSAMLWKGFFEALVHEI
jgi:hypothetical protein